MTHPMHIRHNVLQYVQPPADACSKVAEGPRSTEYNCFVATLQFVRSMFQPDLDKNALWVVDHVTVRNDYDVTVRLQKMLKD